MNISNIHYCIQLLRNIVIKQSYFFINSTRTRIVCSNSVVVTTILIIFDRFILLHIYKQNLISNVHYYIQLLRNEVISQSRISKNVCDT